MEQYWIELLFTIITACITWMARIIGKKLKEEETKQKVLIEGMQAMLRSQMIVDYNKYKEKGYAPIYAKDSFENCWKRYHTLGVNGVMDGIHNEFMELPTSKEEGE